MTALNVVAAVIRCGDRYLACRRTPERGGLWEFPGGKVDPGETPEGALVREIREELGVGVRVIRHLTTDDSAVGDRMIRLACYECELAEAAPTQSSDHDRLEWLEAPALQTKKWAGPDLPVVRLLTGNKVGR